MPDALEIINSVIAQHTRLTEHVKTTGDRMNDIDAVFNIQRTAYKVAWSASSVSEMIAKRDQLLQTISIMEEGLSKHFTFEENVFPLVFGELLMKDILAAHEDIKKQIDNVKTIAACLEGLDSEVLMAHRTRLVDAVNDLKTTVTDHAHAEETILNDMRKVFEK